MTSAADLLRKARQANLAEVPDEMIAKASRPSAAELLRRARDKGLITPSTPYAGVA